MLTLLAPSALVGLSLLAIPIIVHLFKPRKVRQTPFSSLRWLHLTQQRLARRIRWHQVLLFVLRAAFISLLVMAIARPLYTPTGAAGMRELFIVVDISRSMGYRDGDRPSPLETAKPIAAALMSGAAPHDRVAILATGTTTRVIGPLAHGGERHQTALAALEPGLSETDLGAALDVIRPMLRQCRAGAAVELYIFTDNQQGSWRQVAIENLLEEIPDGLRTVIVDVADSTPRNSWIADCRLAEDSSSGRRTLEVQVRSMEGNQERTVRLLGFPGDESRSQNVNVEPGRPTLVTFELPPDADARVKSVEVALEPPDGLPSDDRWFVLLDDEASLRVLLVEGGTAESGFALQTAVESLSSPTQTIRVTTKKFNVLEPEEIRAADVVLWADVPEMSDAVLGALQERVRQGLGLGIFLGPAALPEFYNNKLVDPLDRAAGLFPARLDRVQDVPLSQGGLLPLEDVAWRHPLLAGLFDPSLGDAAQIHARTYYQFAGSLASADVVLATVGGSPAIIEHNVGSGKVVVFNTTANDAWSDLPRRKSFVPLVDRLLNHLSGGVLRRTFQVGDTVTLATAPLAANETIAVVTPNGSSLTPTVTAAANRALLRLPPLAEPGAYRVQRSGAGAIESEFIVQVGRGDSPLAPADTELLRSWWQRSEFSIERTDAMLERLSAGETRFSLSVWLIASAALILAAEMFFAHWLCPRVNPALSASIIRRKIAGVTAT